MNFVSNFSSALRDGRYWLLFNALGIAGYLAIEAWQVVPRIPEEAFNGIDQICFWMTMQFPLLALFFGVNITWIVMKLPSPQHGSFSAWKFGCAAWGLVLLLDPIALKIVYLIVTFQVRF